jgi:transposase
MSKVTIGLDLGDRYSRICVLAGSGRVEEEARVRTERQAMERWFSRFDGVRVAIEVGGHSPWVSRLLNAFGHEVIVANAAKVRAIYSGRRKNDRVDAETLARLARVDPELLAGIEHRDEEAQAHLGELRSREALVRTRTRLINHVRGMVKAMGGRVRRCSAESFHRAAHEDLPEALREGLGPILDMLDRVTAQIRAYDRRFERLIQQRYPETARLTQVPGIGPITALCFVLVLQDPHRFPTSRAVGAFVGLAPAQDQSGETDPQLRITRAGNRMLRRLLVQCAHYQLGPFGPDSDLRRWGLERAARGGTIARKKAVVAVARKLAVMMHRLWVSGADYEPLRKEDTRAAA